MSPLASPPETSESVRSPHDASQRLAGSEHLADAELIRLFVAREDEAAFAEIVRRYAPMVFRVAARTVDDRAAAEDVLQATFLVLVEKAGSLSDPAQLGAWLHGVSLRIARRLVDKRHRHREQASGPESDVMAADVSSDPFERVCAIRDHDVLGEELQRLPTRYRAPLVLRYLDELSNEEAARRLGIRISTLEGRLKRGKKELRRRLARRGVMLSAALLVWNTTTPTLAAASLEQTATQVTAAALGWQSSGSISSPSGPAVTLAQQEILGMSTFKISAAGSLAGMTLLAAGLVVAVAAADGSAESGGRESTAALTPAINTTQEEASTETGTPAPAATVSEAATPPPQRVEVTVFRLQYLQAEMAVRMLESLFADAAGSGSRVAPPTFVPDVRTNSLIVSADSQQFETIRVLLTEMDRPADETIPEAGRLDLPKAVERQNFPLTTAYAADAIQTLESWYWGDAADDPVQRQKLIDAGREQPKFEANEDTNEVTVTATAPILNQAMTLLDRIETGDIGLPARRLPSPFDLPPRSPAERKLQQALRTPADISVDDMAASNVLTMLAIDHDFQLFVDQAALDDLAISLDESPVSLELSGVPVASALDLLLRQIPAGVPLDEPDRLNEFGFSALTYLVEHDLLVITTRTVAEQTMQLQTYDLRPLSEFLETSEAVDVILQMTPAESWDTAGGRGKLVETNSTATILQSPLIHRQIEALLEQLLHAADKTMMSLD